MAFRLNRSQRAEFDKHVDELRNLYDQINAAVSMYNDKQSEFAEFVATIRDDMQSQYDDKSEKWQESDKASAVQDWITAFDNLVSYAESDLDEVSEPDLFPEFDAITDAPEE